MSNHLAIAAVTATLRNLLQNALNEELVGAEVTTVTPDADADLPALGANVFLFQAVPNPAWRNADLPTRSRNGHLVQRPVAALDLHYLLTFYGSEADLEPQRALGIVARTLHAQPVLTPVAIQAAVQAAAGADPDHYLLDADLQAEPERVTLTPLPFTLEELSKLWSVLFQTPYALSMAYLASVVRIEAEETPQRALPVRVRSIAALPFRRVVIERVVAAADARLPVVMGETARLLGTGLGGPVAFVRVGAAELPPVAGSVRGTQMDVALTDPALRAGVLGVQVVYDDGVESTVAPLVLRPDVAVEQDDITADAVPITFSPPVGRRQRVRLLLNAVPGDPPAAFAFDAPDDNGLGPGEDETTEITFPIANVPAGDYLVRVSVDGAESVLTASDPPDFDPRDPDTAGPYDGPSVTIP